MKQKKRFNKSLFWKLGLLCLQIEVARELVYVEYEIDMKEVNPAVLAWDERIGLKFLKFRYNPYFSSRFGLRLKFIYYKSPNLK